MTIGRGESCGLVIDDPEAAIEHAVVEHCSGGLLVRDLGSMNRLLVNKRDAQRAILKHGDALEIGRTRMLVQAFVQAEIAGGHEGGRRIGRRLPKTAVWAVVALGVAAWIWIGRGKDPVSRAPDARTDSPDTDFDPAAAAVAMLDPPAFEPAVSPPPVVTVVTNTTVDPRTEQELQQLKQELALIKHSFQALATQRLPDAVVSAPGAEPRPPPVVQAKPPVSPAPAPPSRAELSGAALKSARGLISKGKLDEAETILEKLQREDPGFLAAYEARAEVFERRGMPDRAMGQWSLLLQRAAGTSVAEKAAGEWARLSEEQRKASKVRSGAVRIRDVEQQRFPDSSDYDEMRLVRVRIERPGESSPPPDLRVEISFFDFDQQTGAVGLTRAMQPRVIAQAPGGWNQGVLTASAAYVAPAGYRAAHPGRFHGYVVRVFSGRTLMDEAARPMDLLVRNSETARMSSP